MKPRLQLLAVAATVLVSLAVAPFAVAQSEAPAPDKDVSTANILITVRIGLLEDGKRTPVKIYSLVVADGTPGSKLLSGQRVPFPKGQVGDSGKGGGFVYQNIGFVAEARAWIVNKKTIKLVADIEDSRISEGQDGAPPTVETRQLTINAMLTDGTPLELTRVEGITDKSGYVEVEAKILR